MQAQCLVALSGPGDTGRRLSAWPWCQELSAAGRLRPRLCAVPSWCYHAGATYWMEQAAAEACHHPASELLRCTPAARPCSNGSAPGKKAKAAAASKPEEYKGFGKK